MLQVLKCILSNKVETSWLEYQKTFSPFFSSRDPRFDLIISCYQDFYKDYGALATFDTIYQNIVALGEEPAIAYLKDAFEATLPSNLDLDQPANFFSFLSEKKRQTFEQDVSLSIKVIEKEIFSSKDKSVVGLSTVVEDAMMALAKVKAKGDTSSAAQTSLLYGEEGRTHLADIYNRTIDAKEKGEQLYYTIGLDSFKDVILKRGDLVMVGGFISNGKSAFCRFLMYHLVVNYGLNFLFISHEMTRDVVLPLLALLHASNRKIFPDAPHISYHDFKNGLLTQEQLDFLFEVAYNDLLNNDAYGSILIEQPGKSKFTPKDLQVRIREVETTIMPLHGVLSDYLTLMHPVDNEKVRPQGDDYNELIKLFKNIVLNHTDVRGRPSPLIGLSPAQISRDGYDKALKNEKRYSVSALAKFSEIEKSADVILTVLSTEEMRGSNRLMLQNLKNRDGEVRIDPVELFCEFKKAFFISEQEEISQERINEVILSMEI